MAKAGCKKEVAFQPIAAGSLDLRTPLGLAFPNALRYVLNADCTELGEIERMPGWTGLMACETGTIPESDPAVPFSRGNLDLHDQLVTAMIVSPSAKVTKAGVLSKPGNGLAITELEVDGTHNFIAGSQISLATTPPTTAFLESVGPNVLTVRASVYTEVPIDTVITGPPTLDVPFINEPVGHLVQFTSACESREFIACTTSRIYTTTGTCANWRILAFGLSGSKSNNSPRWGQIRWMSAQLGNYILFTNNYDYVLSWRIGDAPDEVSGWSASYVGDLLALDILRVGCIASWQGFILVGDIVTGSGRECSKIFWSDFNNPMSWYPGEESLAGFVDLGRTETILRMDPLGGYLKVYTDKAIYNCSLVGGNQVFRFTEVYRGPDALAFRHALTHTDDSHIYLSNRSIMESRLYDTTPYSQQWIHNASGAVFKGVTGRITDGIPGPTKSFGPLDLKLCNEIVMGYDRFRRQVWISWPTVTDGSIEDYAGVKRMSMVMSKLYQQATLVDYAFSAFTSFIPTLNAPVREWMMSIGVSGCTEKSEDYLKPLPYEGACYNRFPPPYQPPYLINPEEDPELPVHPDSICAIYGHRDVKVACAPCFTPLAFSMASLSHRGSYLSPVDDKPVIIQDYAIKQLEPRVRFRERWHSESHSYINDGYATVLQSEHSTLSSTSEKRVYWVNVDFTHTLQSIPINLHAQVGVGGAADCMVWSEAKPFPVACDTELSVPQPTRQPGGPSFPFYETGRFASWRLFVSSGAGDGPYNFEPVGGEMDFNRLDMTVAPVARCL